MGRLLAVLLMLGGLVGAYAGRAPVRSSWHTAHFEIAASAALAPELPRMAALAERAYDSLSVFYGYTLPRGDRLRLVLLGEEDYSNGYAIGFAGWVAVYMTPADFALRGNPGWHANVLSHEISHVISLRKLGYTSSYLGHSLGIGYTGGRGKVQASFGPYPADLESWLAEGLAQLGAEACGLDRWDAVRDALEREAYFAGDLPSLPALKTFHQDSRRAELLYNQGYSFMRWVRLNLDDSRWHAMLDEAGRSSLQYAIGQALGQDFSKAFEAWRSSRASRHESYASAVSSWPAPPVLQKPAGAYSLEAWKVSSAKGTWRLHSLANAQGEMRLYGPDSELVERDALGFLWASHSGDRVLYGAQPMDISHLRLNRLMEARAPDWESYPVPGGERVQGACYTGESLWVIMHRGGRNRVGLLENGAFKELGGTPAALEPMEIACSESQVVVSATHGSGRHLYALGRSQDAVSWTLLAGSGVEDARHPVLRKDTLYYSSDRAGSFQIYAQALGEEKATLLTAERGGAFYPSCIQDTLYYSALRGNALQGVAWNGAPSQDLDLKGEPGIAPPISSLPPVAYRPSFDDPYRLSFLGWYTSTMASYSPQAAPDSAGTVESIWSWSAVAGGLWTNPSLSNEWQAYAGALGSVGSSVYTDGPGYVAGAAWRNSRWSPDLSLQLQVLGRPTRDSLWSDQDTIEGVSFDDVWLTALALDFSAWQPLTSRLGLAAVLSYAGYGISLDQGSATVRETASGNALLTWQSYESGVRHPYTGIVAQGGGGIQWLGVLPQYTGVSVLMPAVGGAVTLYGHAGRLAYMSLGAGLQGVDVPSDEDLDEDLARGWQWAAQANASIDIPLPWPELGFRPSPSKGISWTALELHLGYAALLSDELLQEADVAGYRQGLLAKSWSTQSGARPVNASLDGLRERGHGAHSLEASLRWEVLSFANARGNWEMGFRAPPDSWEDWGWYVGLVF